MLYGGLIATLTNNIAINNSFNGIELFGSASTTLINNSAKTNYYSGICATGMNFTLTNNTLIKNINGISLYNCDFSLSIFNTLKDNINYGIFIDQDSENNTIHHNSFIGNNINGTSQALDNGTNNLWFDNTTNEGNYWSDWSGAGNYTIDGSANTVDPYPFISPPFLSHPYFFISTLQGIIIKLTN